MELIVKKENRMSIVVVKGKMDAGTAPEFENKLNELIAQGENYFIIDFSELTYISSAGLRSVLASAKKLKTTKDDYFLHQSMVLLRMSLIFQDLHLFLRFMILLNLPCRNSDILQ